jgi:hypothetical protein
MIGKLMRMATMACLVMSFEPGIAQNIGSFNSIDPANKTEVIDPVPRL